MIFKLKIAVALAMVVVLAGFAVRYTFLVQRNTQLSQGNKAKDAIIGVQTAAINEWQESAAIYQKQVQAMALENKKAFREFRELSNVFAKHDFNAVSNAKPKLVERRINRGTARTLRLLECATDRNCKTKNPTPTRPDSDNDSSF